MIDESLWRWGMQTILEEATRDAASGEAYSRSVDGHARARTTAKAIPFPVVRQIGFQSATLRVRKQHGTRPPRVGVANVVRLVVAPRQSLRACTYARTHVTPPPRYDRVRNGRRRHRRRPQASFAAKVLRHAVRDGRRGSGRPSTSLRHRYRPSPAFPDTARYSHRDGRSQRHKSGDTTDRRRRPSHRSVHRTQICRRADRFPWVLRCIEKNKIFIKMTTCVN